MVALLFACTLVMPASTHDVDVFKHCQDNVDSWNLGIQWEDLVSFHFEPEDHLVAYKIIGCESSGFAAAKNPTSTAKGLWQFINKTWYWVSSKLDIEGSALDPHTSTHFAAFLKYKTSQGWGHWSESAHCWKEPNEKISLLTIH